MPIIHILFTILHNRTLLLKHTVCAFSLCFPFYKWEGGGIDVLHGNENPIYVFLFRALRGRSPNFHIHVPVSD
jgi:hypothetical protein